jgi:hypothetical protein
MNDREIFNSKLAKKFARGLMLAIVLFAIIIEGIVSLVITSGKIHGKDVLISGVFLGNKVDVLTWFLVLFPLLVFGVILWLAKQHGADVCFKHSEYILKMRMQEMAEETRLKKEHDEHLFKMRKLEIAGEACLVVAKNIKIDPLIGTDVLTKLEQMLDKISKYE